MRYNDNIELIRVVHTSENAELAPDVYYALMVTDKPHNLDSRRFFNECLGYLGLEQTSNHKIYISKDFLKRKDLYRGLTFAVKVNNPKLCSIL